MGVKIQKKVVSFDTWQGRTAIPPGYSVYIHYKEGLWNINPGKHGGAKYGPEGSNVVATNEAYPMVGEKEGCLIGRLIFPKSREKLGVLTLTYPSLEEANEDNETLLFPVSPDGILIPKTDYPKRLDLRCNDIDTGVFDNEGELYLEVEIW